MRDLDTVDFGLEALPGRELHDVLHGFRARGPVQPTRYLGLPAFVITGHAALLAAFQDVARFPPYRMYERTIERAVGRTFISMDDPEHRVFRKLATPAFRSRAVERYEREGLAALAHELLDALEERRSFDLVEGFTERFPYLVISRLLGLPREGEDAFHSWALALLRFPQDPAGARKAAEELTAFLAPVLEARRRAPRGDVISELVAARVDGRALGDEEIASHVRLLLPTGGETTYGSLGNLLYALLSEEGNGRWEALRRDPSRIPAAVDEALRWETPVAVLPRLSAPEAVAFGGHAIPPDSWVLFAIAGANRDPALFPDPDRFDVERRAPDALTFGRGVKSCPGMHLARKSLAVALQVLLERLPRPALCDAEAARPRRTVLRSPEALRVERRTS